MRREVPRLSLANMLRQELAARSAAFAKQGRLLHVESYGAQPVIVYEPSEDGLSHGNFFPASYTAILQNPAWSRRLQKVHSQASRTLPRRDRRWVELDTSNSSDALLMNIFCHPEVPDLVSGMLGIPLNTVPVFGLRARVPLSNGHLDRTEIDMQLGDLLVEAKLTETGFQRKARSFVNTYRDFAAVFRRTSLPRSGGDYFAYQLIRNVLAAHAMQASFCVFLDQRRPDLLEDWYSIMRSLRDTDLKTRCKVLTWQELSAVLPVDLRRFLDVKYGIVPQNETPSRIGHPDSALE